MLSSAPYQTIDDAIAGLATLESGFRAQHDRRCVFLTVYGMMTRQMKQRTASGFFMDNDWAGRYTVAFANQYLVALCSFEGQPSQTPAAWRIAFDTSVRGQALILQDLFLGINGHISNDLAFALTKVGIDPDRSTRYQDHTAINQILSDVTDAVEARLNELYTPGFAGIQNCPVRIDREAANFSLPIAREGAWESAVALANARNDAERSTITFMIEQRAAVLAKLILAPNLDPLLIARLHEIELGTTWWEALK